MNTDRRRAFVQMLGRRAEFADACHGMKCADVFDIEDGAHDLRIPNDYCRLF
jgi:hypothetical protein